MIFPKWFEYLEECFSYKNVCPPAKNINENSDLHMSDGLNVSRYPEQLMSDTGTG